MRAFFANKSSFSISLPGSRLNPKKTSRHVDKKRPLMVKSTGKKKKNTSYSQSEKIGIDGGYMDVTVTYSLRRTIGIAVRHSGEIQIRVPFHTSMPEIKRVIEVKKQWILSKHRHFIENFPKYSPPTYQSGETHFYLGGQYVLRPVRGAKDGVHIEDGQLVVSVKEADHTGKVLKKWMRGQACRIIPDISGPIIENFYEKHGKKPLSIRFRKMKRRWGSCSSSGTILLNTELVRASETAIAYVITHELCHLIHHNHSKAYYGLLSSEFPDWKHAKKMLESVPLNG